MERFEKREERKADEAWRARVSSGVREARKQLRYSQVQLANRVGVDPGAISDIEIGKTDPTISMLETIADVLNVSLDDLVGRQRVSNSHQWADEPLVVVTPRATSRKPALYSDDNSRGSEVMPRASHPDDHLEAELVELVERFGSLVAVLV